MTRQPAVGADDHPALVTSASELDCVISSLREAERYALDTEFHRERTYWPHLALVQVAWSPGRVALIDPLAVDVAPFREILAGPGEMVAHAAEQDLLALERACGAIPSRLLDTQVAAAFCGHGSASLATLTKRYLGVDLPKGDRLTDWRRRPLSASQRRYAAADVEGLLDLAAALEADLQGRGRVTWAADECELLRRRGAVPADPKCAWWKLRDARQLHGVSRGVAQEVAAWREQRARETDMPARAVLPDLALQSIVHRPPADVAALRQVRGLDGRHLRADVATEVLAAIDRGRSLPPEAIRLPPADDAPRDLRPAVTLAMAWVAQVARDADLDTGVLATRADVVAWLRGQPNARLGEGWRAGLVGMPLRRLVSGEASVAFDGKGELVLEARSRLSLS
ncbi:MAG: HRDC domain-containing protein [Acidimicrobiaceae bacterium]|nr:HRDC domain-containing protein [Acidimicrobiaceae bacterium]